MYPITEHKAATSDEKHKSINFLNIVVVFIPEIAFVLLWMLSRNLSYRGFQNNTRSHHYLYKYF